MTDAFLRPACAPLTVSIPRSTTTTTSTTTVVTGLFLWTNSRFFIVWKLWGTRTCTLFVFRVVFSALARVTVSFKWFAGCSDSCVFKSSRRTNSLWSLAYLSNFNLGLILKIVYSPSFEHTEREREKEVRQVCLNPLSDSGSDKASPHSV